ncbi:MAG: C39 family peptidase [Myxococcales bacterium]|nr:C39 family peptidase [Myxococcales bacterium]
MSRIGAVTSRPQSQQAAPVQSLPQGRDAQLSLEQLWPYLQKYAEKYGADPKILAGIIAQESGFKNYGVHQDGTGHGLIGLDDNGLLPSFEQWSGVDVGRGSGARTIPPELQVEFLAKTIGELTRTHGDGFAAAREWHRGRGAMNDSAGYNYQKLIQGHIAELFPNGQTPSADGPVPDNDVPSQAPPRPDDAPASQPVDGGSYRIQSGDTLWGIASRLKAQGMQGSHWDIINQIVSMNPQIKDPNLIYAGDTLKLPGVAGAAQSTYSPPAQLPDPVDLSPAQQVEEVGDRGQVDGSQVPFISQYRPAGAERGYSNGPANCGPTSMAMLARAFGYGAGMTDAELINHLGRIGGTGANGTGVNGIAAMAQAMGKGAETRGPGPQVEWMAEQLRAGKMVVANGDYFAMPPHQNESRTSGHYVAVAGLDAQGNFIVRDPADQNVRTVTPEQMAHFIRSNPNGGYQVAIG